MNTIGNETIFANTSLDKICGQQNSSRKMIIVFSGFNQRAVIAFLRTLEKHSDVCYRIIACTSSDTILNTIYASKVSYVRKIKSLDIEEITYALRYTMNLCEFYQSIIPPTSEGLNRFFLNNRELFESIGCHIPLVDKILYETVSDKYKFAKLCLDNGLLVPKEFGNKPSIPCVAKPLSYSSNKGKVYSPVIIKNGVEFEEFASKCDTDAFFYQQYITGESYYLLYYFGMDNKVVRFSQVNILQQPFGKSILAAKPSNIHESEIGEKYEELLRNINWKGLIMIELRKHNNEFFMIEANPRFWGPIQLCDNSGINLFEPFLIDIGVCKDYTPEFVVNKSARYLWHGGIVQVLNAGNEVVEFSDINCRSIMNDKEWLKYDIYNSEDTIKLYDNND